MKLSLQKIKIGLALAGLALVASSSGFTAVTYRVFATREGLVGHTTANGHVITPRDHFCALPSGTVLNSNGGRTYTVNLYNPANGRRVNNVPVWDIGPWNIHDNYWHSPRSTWPSLPRGKPEAQAAYEDGFNGGKDGSGRIVGNPAGIDLADGTFWDDLGMTANGWIDVTFNWEVGSADRHIVGDWDGNGSMTPGVVRKENGNLVWYLRNSNSAGSANITFAYGLATDLPVFGDWDGNGTFTPGIRRGNVWYLRNANSSGNNDIAAFSYGLATDFATVGDWDGNNTMTVGVIRNSNGNWQWSLRNANSAGSASYVFNYGVAATDSPVTGDWDNNGTWTPGVYRENTWYLRNANSTGSHSIVPFSFGQPSDDAIVGDWDGNGTMTIGVVRGNVWYLRNSNSAGAHNYTFGYGQ